MYGRLLFRVSNFHTVKESSSFFRNLSALAERSDVSNTCDEFRSERNLTYGYENQNRETYVRNSGRVELSQSSDRVYGQNEIVRNDSNRHFDKHFEGTNYEQNYYGAPGNFTNGGQIRVPHLGNLGNSIQNHSGMSGYQPKWNEVSTSGTFDSQGRNKTELAGVSDESQPICRIEDLDELCSEGKVKEAVETLRRLESQGIPVDLPRYLALMKVCSENRALEEAKSVHEYLLKSIPNPEVRIFNKILEMYSVCGSMNDAFTVFDQMPKRNLTSWDVMICGLAKNGYGEDSITLFEQFKKSGLTPDGEIFLGAFSACGVLGDSIEGILHFESMSKDFGIVPSMDHYTGMVDMLGTAGYLDEALEFIEKMPFEPGVDIWETLMNLSRSHGNTELGDRCAEIVQNLDPLRLNEQSRDGLIPICTSELAREKERKRLNGQNLLEVRSRVHEYRAGDRSHPDHEKIYALLGGLRQQMKEIGYIAETKFVLHDVDIESKEEALMAHSERLAAAQGFMTTPARSPLRIIKNLRVCGDCHNAFKIISKIVGREIIARDSKRFHHFKDGLCSCNDYW